MGYGLYFAIVESIAFELETNSPMPDLEDTAQDIAEFFNEDTVKIEEIMKYSIQQKLFEHDENTGRIICLKLLTHLDNTMSSNPEIKKILTNFKKLQETLSNSKQIRLDKNREDKIRIDKKKEKKKKPESEELKAKRQSLIDFFCINYEIIYKLKLDITGKEIGSINKLIKKPDKELNLKCRIFKEICEKKDNDFYKFIPSKLLYLWNDLVESSKGVDVEDTLNKYTELRKKFEVKK